jgi:hypothetical protein
MIVKIIVLLLTNTKYSLKEQIDETNIPHKASCFDFSDKLVEHKSQQRKIEKSE